MNFGKVPVLAEHYRTLLVHNPSPITADFKLFIEGRDSLFSVLPREMRLAPGEDGQVTVRAVLDETLTFKDELHVLIEEGADIPVSVEAVGTGNTLVSDELSGDVLDFSHQFAGRPFSKEVTIHNMGRRQMALTINNERIDEIKKMQPKGTGKKFEVTQLPPEEQPVFLINPDKMLVRFYALNSGGACSSKKCNAARDKFR